jgi:hypothetical protein
MEVQAFYKNFENPCYFTIEVSPLEASCLIIKDENVSGKLRQHLFSLLEKQYNQNYLMPLVEKIKEHQNQLKESK